MKRVFKAIALIAFFVLLTVCLFDPIAFPVNIANLTNLRQKFPHARALWESQNIKSYKIDVRGFIPLSCVYDATLTIINNQVVEALVKSRFFEQNSTPKPLTLDQWTGGPCNYSRLTNQEMFELIDNRLSSLDPFENQLTVTFDDHYGYVTRYDYRYGVGRGVFTSSVSECCIWYEFSNFQPIQLNSETP